MYFFNSISTLVTGISDRFTELIDANKSLTILSELIIMFKIVKLCFVS